MAAARAGWYTDPLGRHDVRYWSGSRWTDHVATDGEPSRDPGPEAEGQPAPATDPLGTDPSRPPTLAAAVRGADAPAAEDAVPPPGAAPPGRRSTWTLRRPLLIALLAGTAAVTFAIGAVVGIASGQSEKEDLRDENELLQRDLTDVAEERDTLERDVSDRQAQMAADRAEATRIREERRARREAEAQRAAEEAQRAAEAAAAEAERQNTIPGEGVFGIGTDYQPGLFRTEGPSGGNPVGCYYAVLNSPDTFDIASNNIVNGPATVELAAGVYFETSSCLPWVRVR